MFANYSSDIPAVAQGIFKVHPEFKQEMFNEEVDYINEDGEERTDKVPYILLTMPEVNDERYDVLKDGVKVVYDDTKVKMENVIANAEDFLNIMMLLEVGFGIAFELPLVIFYLSILNQHIFYHV